MRRLFLDLSSIEGDIIHVKEKDDISYISEVLRMRPGDGLFISDGKSRSFETQIADISKTGIELRVLAEKPFDDGYVTRVTLYQGLPKGAKMDEIVRKSTELGVCRIAPVITARSIPEYGKGVPSAKTERWLRVAEEASRQSRRAAIPQVLEPAAFKDALNGLKNLHFDKLLVLYELEEKHTLKMALREDGPKPSEIAVFIGPEGGFEPSEVESLIAAGAEAVTVGDTILRTETAGPAAISMILYELELS